MKPTIGRLVHYVMLSGAHRAAMVVDVDWNTKVLLPNVDLSVFLAPADGLAAAIDKTMWVQNPRFSEGMEPDTWHWPERE